MQKALSALVVHDIKNALALLEIDLEQLNHREGVPEEGRRAYRRCLDLKNRLINFLTLYKHDQHGLVPLPAEVDLGEFIEDVVSNSQSAMMAENHHGHEIVVRADFSRIVSDGAGIALFDENLLELALESALNNAVRYAHREVRVWFEQQGGELTFRVQDDGVGVGIVDKLVQRKVAEKSSSTGLGLALCRAVAEVHGSGSVELTSVPGGGTLFSLTLKGVLV